MVVLILGYALASTAQMAQTEEFMFQNVAYRTTAYRNGVVPINLGVCVDFRPGIEGDFLTGNPLFVVSLMLIANGNTFKKRWLLVILQS